jgi:hypothetical protein
MGNGMEEEAGGEQIATDSAIDHALAEAASRVDPVPASVVDAAKKAYEQRPPTSGVSADSDAAEATSAQARRTKTSAIT